MKDTSSIFTVVHSRSSSFLQESMFVQLVELLTKVAVPWMVLLVWAAKSYPAIFMTWLPTPTAPSTELLLLCVVLPIGHTCQPRQAMARQGSQGMSAKAAKSYPAIFKPAPINNRLNVVVQSPAPFGLGRNGCWLSRGSKLPRPLPFIFSLCCPLNDRRRAAHSFFKIGRLFSLFLFSCPSLALLRLLILLLLLMSGNVSNPGPIFSCSVCTGNVTWWGKSM